MVFEALAIGLTIRCLVVTNRLRGSFFHAQAWKAWMTFFAALLALHVAEVVGVGVFGVARQPSTLFGDVVEAAVMVALWLAVELSMSTLSRRWLETHEEVRAVERACARRMRRMQSDSGVILQPNGPDAHSQVDPYFDSVATSHQGNRA